MPALARSAMGSPNGLGRAVRARISESFWRWFMTTPRKKSPDRRQFMFGLAGSGATLLASEHLAAGTLFSQVEGTGNPTEVAEIFPDLHRVHKWDDSNGDTWDPFWADDDLLYAFNCDGRGFGRKPMNLAFNQLSGDSAASLVGSQVNEMDEYGKANQKESDNATWKACGQECIDGVFYAFVSRNVYGSDSHDPLTRQLAVNASLIKSTDRGRTWSRPARENYDRPMWPGARFGAPFFVHYGRNGGQVGRDGATDYVYACSTNGFWNDGDSLILGRVRRALLPNLNSAHWEYLTAADSGAGPSWSPQIEKAVPVLDRPARCGQTPITYISELGIYLLISWYNTERMTKWFEPNEMRYDFYQAPHPWGRWKQIGSFSDRFLGPTYHMYGPSICARFQQRRDADVEVALFTSGCPFDDVPASPYKMWTIPLILRTSPLPSSVLIPADDPRIHYQGPWFPWTTTDHPAPNGLSRATMTKGSTAELAFSGTGIEYIAAKASDQGTVDISLDDMHEHRTSLRLADFPIFLGVSIFSKHKLPPGQHKIRIVNTEESRISLEAFRVYA